MAFLEPNFPKDGRILMFRQGGNRAIGPWTDSTGTVQTGNVVDAVYSVNDNPDGQTACDITQFNDIYPLSHAPYDSTVNTRYGFAMHRFRDSKNNELPEVTNIRSYPWIDKDADNVSLATMGTNLFNSGYEHRCPAGISCIADGDSGTGTSLNGRVMMGLWTQGKMVLLDNIINNIDFGLKAPSNTHREVRLYEGNNDAERYVRAGNGRDATTSLNGFPEGASYNTTFLDSNEHRFNYHQRMVPTTAFDVVWTMSSGRGTTEVPFDDYSNVNGFIVANMAQALRHNPNGTAGDQVVNGELQNAATSLDWNIPESGVILGNTVVEPVANGGIHGKGLWLDGDGDGLSFTITSQPQGINSVAWYYGLFIDLRTGNGDKSLITYPDGTEIQLHGRGQLVFVDNSNTDIHTISLASDIRPRKGRWSHLAFQLSNGNQTVETYLDGNLIDTFTHTSRLFRLQQGDLVLGQSRNDNDLHGWIDDFKVFAEYVNPEVACNHANGTMVGLTSSAPAAWSTVANALPASTHSALTTRLTNSSGPTFSQYVCYKDYSDDHAAHLQNIPTGLVSVRHSLVFPEGPLLHDAPRPDSTSNEFCLSCHTVSGKGGFSLGALTLNPLFNAADDPRRQPMQPDPKIYGNIPANWLGNGLPATHTRSSTGFNVDTLLLPSVND